jgi:hypothetical protein
MPKERGQDHEWIEVGDAFDRFAVAQHESVHARPFNDFASDAGVKPEFNEHDVTISTPTVDVST